MEIGAIRAASYNNLDDIVNLLHMLGAARTTEDRISIWLQCQRLEDAWGDPRAWSATWRPFEPQTSAALDTAGMYEPARPDQSYRVWRNEVIRQMLSGADDYRQAAIETAAALKYALISVIPPAAGLSRTRNAVSCCATAAGWRRNCAGSSRTTRRCAMPGRRRPVPGLSETSAAELAVIALARENEDLRRQVRASRLVPVTAED